MTAVLRALVVEDSEDDAALIIRALRRRYPGLQHRRVDDARSLLAALEEPWDVVISDWTLPRFSGAEAFTIVEASGLDLPFIIVSGSIGEERAVDAVRSGARDYVLKDKLSRLVPAVEREVREKQMRDELQRQRDEHDRFFKLSVGLLAIIGYDGCFKQLNPAWQAALDWSIEELLERPWLDLVHPEDRELAAAEWAWSRDHGTRVHAFACRCRARDGGYRHLEWTAASFADEGVTYAAARDTTDRRRMEEELRRARDELESRVEQRTQELHVANERLARELAERQRAEEAAHRAQEAAERASRAKSAFLANMSHEIRTPMNAILGYTQLLQRDPQLGGKQREHLEVIRRSGDHLLSLINDVLEMSKIEAGHVQLDNGDVDLARILGDLARMFQLRADAKQLGFAVERAPEVPRYVVCDERKLWQILVNLLSNAVKFTERGRVTVRLRTRPGAAGGLRLFAAIEDTGPGIDPDELPGLFRPFEQTRVGIRATGGTGLGLALSRELARLMGGDITVRSNVGKGSVFEVEVAIAIGRAPVVERAAPRAGMVVGLASGTGPARILLVDDDADNRGWVTQLLQQIGFEVHVAADGAEGLAEFDRWRPHLVLMDMNMPVMDGYTATRAVRARSDTPIVAMTASAFDDSREAIFEAGATGWLRKPCREAELLEEIRRHLGVEYRHHELAAPPSTAPPPAGRRALEMPPELADELREAARIADFEGLQALIDELPPDRALEAAELRRLVDAYAYDEIEALLREIRG